MIPSKKIKFGLIGCGRISARHFEAMEALKDDIELVAVCDIKEERAEDAAKKYKTKNYRDYRAMLDKEVLDVVSVCAPNGLHAQMGIDIAKSQKHALMEKPLAINLKEARKLIKSFKERDQKLFGVMQVRYNPPIVATKNIIQEKKLGKIYSGSLRMYWSRPQEYYDKDEWRGTKKMDGGSLLNQGIHYIDILQWLLGPAVSVFAKADTVAHRIEIEDIVTALLTLENGAYVTVEFTVCAYPKNLECSITVLGEKGSVKLGGSAVNEIEVWEVKDLPMPVLPPGLPPNVYAGGLYQGSCPNHYFVYKDLVRTLKENKEVGVDGREAMKSLEIVEAIYRSARENREIFLPLK